MSGRHGNRKELLAVGAMLGISLAWMSITAISDFRSAERNAYSILQASASQRTTHLQGIIRNVDLLLQSYAKEGASMSANARGTLDREFLEVTRRMPELSAIVMTDASGTVTSAWSGSALGVSIADRDYFREHRDTPAGKSALLISRPLRAKVIGSYSIILSRSVSSPEGAFNGLVLATLDPAFFSEVLRLAPEVPVSAAILANRHGDVIFATPAEAASLIGTNVGDTMIVRTHTDSGRKVSSFGATVEQGRYRGLFVFHDVPGTDLFILVTGSHAALTREWARRSWPRLALFCVLLAMVLAAYLRLERNHARLAEAERFSRSLIETASDAVVGFDAEGAIRLLNPSAERLFGYDASELLGADWRDILLPPEDRDAIREEFKRIIASRESAQHYRMQVLNGAGNPVQVSWSYTSIEANSQGIVLIAFGRDITEKLKRNQELQRISEDVARLSAWRSLLLDSAGEGIFGVDVEGRITFINQAGLALFGYGEEELVGREAHPLVHGTSEDGRNCPIELCPVTLTLRDGTPRKVEDTFRRKDGTTFMVELSTTAIRDQGSILGVEVVFSDITHRKQMEQELVALATTDALTGLPNRRSFLQEMEEELALERISPSSVSAFLMLDLDHFKNVNDSHGHACGDAVLVACAREIKRALRISDLVGRLGGEEFGIFLRLADPLGGGARREDPREDRLPRHSLRGERDQDHGKRRRHHDPPGGRRHGFLHEPRRRSPVRLQKNGARPDHLPVARPRPRRASSVRHSGASAWNQRHFFATVSSAFAAIASASMPNFFNVRG